MTSFLITFKPSTENPERGMPLGELQSLVRHLRKGDTVEEKWRFRNWKDVTPGDQAFLLLQGKRGPAIIGYGQVSRKPKKAENWVGIKFDDLVDPTTHVLASKEQLIAVEGSERF